MNTHRIWDLRDQLENISHLHKNMLLKLQMQITQNFCIIKPPFSVAKLGAHTQREVVVVPVTISHKQPRCYCNHFLKVCDEGREQTVGPGPCLPCWYRLVPSKGYLDHCLPGHVLEVDAF